MTKDKKKFADPYFEREKKKYKEPIPSREAIIQVLEKEGEPLSFNRLCASLSLRKETKKDALSFRLKAMLRDGQLMLDRKNRYCLVKKVNLIRGRVISKPDGFGFFVPEEGGEDLFISPKQMRGVMHGDIVLAFDAGLDKRGRHEAQIHEIIEHANTTIIGRFYSEAGVSFVEPENKCLTQPVAIAPEDIHSATEGQVVLVEIIYYPTKRHAALGRVLEVLGDHMAPGMEIDIAIHAHNLPCIWPQAVLDEVQALPVSVQDTDLDGRLDLRELDFVTIDGEDAKDFDDAVFCQRKKSGGFQLYVAIADVGHYVKPGSVLDKEAYKRATSVYFPGRVIPMLPEQLSNGLCSLNPNVDRLAMVAELAISGSGKITRSRFYKAVIHSKARLTYTDVAAAIDKKFKNVTHMPDLGALYELFTVLLKSRKKRGAIEFDTVETRIVFNEERKIDTIIPSPRNDAHRLIEECMLAANVAAARHLKNNKLAALFRVHEPPSQEKIQTLREFLGPLGLKLEGGDKPSPKHFLELMDKIQGRHDKSVIETVLLRSLTQAVYAEKNKGHFGLAYKAYTHFTSPIRRYPDLLTHRSIAYNLVHNSAENYIYNMQEMHDYGEHCSLCERRADEATRDVVSWLKCEYMQTKLGETFWGRVVSVTHFGVFVALDELFVEGLVHLTSLPPDYYQFDKIHHCLRGNRHGKTYGLGDKLHVRVIRVGLDERKIDFELYTTKE